MRCCCFFCLVMSLLQLVAPLPVVCIDVNMCAYPDSHALDALHARGILLCLHTYSTVLVLLQH
jgi:hypothetical protein